MAEFLGMYMEYVIVLSSQAALLAVTLTVSCSPTVAACSPVGAEKVGSATQTKTQVLAESVASWSSVAITWNGCWPMLLPASLCVVSHETVALALVMPKKVVEVVSLMVGSLSTPDGLSPNSNDTASPSASVARTVKLNVSHSVMCL